MTRETRIRLLNHIYILPHGEVRIGRDPTCQIHLEGDLVSRVHAVLDIGDATTTLTDSGSENGTFLNGARLDAPATVKHGDHLRVAFFDLTYEEQEKSSTTGKTIHMIFCTECGAVLSPEMRFCTQCGARARRPALVTTCPACSANLTADMRFCFRCGQKLPT